MKNNIWRRAESKSGLLPPFLGNPNPPLFGVIFQIWIICMCCTSNESSEGVECYYIYIFWKKWFWCPKKDKSCPKEPKKLKNRHIRRFLKTSCKNLQVAIQTSKLAKMLFGWWETLFEGGQNWHLDSHPFLSSHNFPHYEDYANENLRG